MVSRLRRDALDQGLDPSAAIAVEAPAWEDSNGVLAGASAFSRRVQDAIATQLELDGAPASVDRSDLNGKGILGAIVRGAYRVVRGGVDVSLKLIDLRTGGILSETKRTLTEPSLASELSSTLLPPQSGTAGGLGKLVAGIAAGVQSDFEIQIYSERGQNGVYVEGERLNLEVQSAEDCHVRIYHLNWSTKELTLLYPNRYEHDDSLAAGEIRRIPSESSPFEFAIGPPFGVDVVFAVASRTPFADDEAVETALDNDSESVSANPDSTTDDQSEEDDAEFLVIDEVDEDSVSDVASRGIVVRERKEPSGLATGDDLLSRLDLGEGTARAFCFVTSVPGL